MAQNFDVSGAPLELLDVGELAMMHRAYKPVDTWLLDTFFPRRFAFNNKKQVPIAELDIHSDIAPLVAPKYAGKAFDPTTAIQVGFVDPAYLKPKNQVAPQEAYDIALLARLRDAGVISTGSNQLSLQEQYMYAQLEVMKRNRDSIDNFKVLMAAEYLTTGIITLESDLYEKNVVSYGRDASMHFTPATPWDQTGAKPVTDIETMMQLMIDGFSGTPKKILTTNKVYGYLSKNDEFKDRFTKPYTGINAPFAGQLNVSDGAQYKGLLDTIEIWTYDATYRTKAGTQRIIPDDFFAIIADTDGVIAHCAIQNIEANGMASDYFDSQWLQKDPSAIQLMSESAPLIVPSNKNGVCGGTGFIS
ncbi:major capsid protein [Acinetobacter sp. ANC 5383]